MHCAALLEQSLEAKLLGGISMRRYVSRLSAFLALIVLAACGGGGGGGGGSAGSGGGGGGTTLQPISYQGNTSQATVTTANAKHLLDVVISSSQQTGDLGDIGATAVVTSQVDPIGPTNQS